MIRIQNATWLDAEELAANMRASDRVEVWASDRQTPFRALEVALQVSDCSWSLVIDGEVAAIWGVRLTPNGYGIVWLLTSEVVNRKPVAFWKVFRAEVPRLLERYPVLCNMVDARYTKAVRALKATGFTVHDPQPYGPEGRPFHFVILRRERHASCNGESTQARRVQDGQVRKTEAKGRYLERGARPLRVRHASQDRVETTA